MRVPMVRPKSWFPSLSKKHAWCLDTSHAIAVRGRPVTRRATRELTGDAVEARVRGGPTAARRYGRAAAARWPGGDSALARIPSTWGRRLSQRHPVGLSLRARARARA